MVNLSLLLTSVLTFGTLAAAVPGPKPKAGPFVKTDGTRFTLDGKDFHYAGSNAYYFPFYNVRPTSPSSWLHIANGSRIAPMLRKVCARRRVRD